MSKDPCFLLVKAKLPVESDVCVCVLRGGAWTFIEPLKLMSKTLHTNHNLHDSILRISCNLNIKGKLVNFIYKLLMTGQKDG